MYPADLEAILERSPDIAGAAVLGAPDGELGEVPVAFVVPAPRRSLTSEQVLDLFDSPGSPASLTIAAAVHAPPNMVVFAASP